MTINKQRLDAYVQAIAQGIVANPNGGLKVSEIYAQAVRLITYVDLQQKEQEDSSWTENTGVMPVAKTTAVDIHFSDKDVRNNIPAGNYRWELNNPKALFHITKWRLAQ